MKTRTISIFLALLCFKAWAQPKEQLIDINIIPLETDWVYEIGNRVDFQITVHKNGRMLEGRAVTYEIGLEGMPPEISKTVYLGNQPLMVKGISLKTPGFVRCTVKVNFEGREYSALGAAAVAPYDIAPTVEEPSDFDAFWKDAKAALAAIPINAKMELQPDSSQPNYDVYHVTLDNLGTPGWDGKSKFYGILSIPKGEGRFPALLNVPGAGVRRYYDDSRANEGVIVFQVGIHGIPVNMENDIYSALGGGALSQYASTNMHDKDRYYYKRVYMGCVRAADFIFSLPQFDGENLIVNGGSQGGALSIITAALDERIKGLVAFYPALSDMTGYLYGRVGGWPHQFKDLDPKIRPFWEDTARYYDVVNFAKRLKVPGWYSWGYNDPVCPPTTMFAVYNSIKAPKELHLFEETGHWTYPEQWEMANAWIFERLKK